MAKVQGRHQPKGLAHIIAERNPQKKSLQDAVKFALRCPWRVRKPAHTREFREAFQRMPKSEDWMAEREGFEPSVPLPVRQISNLVPSTTRPPLRVIKSRIFQGFASPVPLNVSKKCPRFLEPAKSVLANRSTDSVSMFLNQCE
jgi:hypothetical protein